MHGLSDINWLFHKYYSDNPELRRIVTVHSEQVAKKALTIRESKKIDLDPKIIYSAALLHDIGVVKCHAPAIHSLGVLPYLQHGIEGKKILDENGLDFFSSICLKHTGAGISIQDIEKYNLPLPKIDMVPSTVLEKLICYSDKFYSKSSNLNREKPLEQVINQIVKFGPESISRFLELHRLFGP